MKRFSMILVLFLAACGAAPIADPSAQPSAEGDACATCKADEVCHELEAGGVCIPASVESAMTHAPVANPMKANLCNKILTRCVNRCSRDVFVQCSASCVDDFIDCVTP
jgi:hypothetical protein